MVFPRLLQRLDHAIAQSEAPLDRECLKAERVSAMARLGMMVEARMALAQLKAHLRRQAEPRLQGWVTFAEAVVAYCSDSENPGIPAALSVSKQSAISTSDAALYMHASTWLATIHFNAGRFTSFADELIGALGLPSEEGEQMSARWELCMARAYSYAGRNDLAQSYFKVAHRLATLEGDTAMISGIIMDRSTFHTDALALEDAFEECDPDAARRVMIEIDSVANFNAGIGNAARISWSPMLKALLCMCMRRYDEAAALLETHMRTAMAEGLGGHSAYFHAARALCLWHIGEHMTAKQDLNAAVAQVEDMQDADDLAATHARLSVLLRLMGQDEGSRRHRALAEQARLRLRHAQEELFVQLSRVASERRRHEALRTH